MQAIALNLTRKQPATLDAAAEALVNVDEALKIANYHLGVLANAVRNLRARALRAETEVKRLKKAAKRTSR
jgi:hypothetical protein